MKLISFKHDNMELVGVVEGETVQNVTAVAPTMLSLIEKGADGLAQVRQAAALAEKLPLKAVTLLAPIPIPRRNIMCLGWNYAEHAAESAGAKGLEIKELPQVPIIFTKATTAVNGPFADIELDTAVTQQLDWEVELAVIIGKAGRNIPRSQALQHIFGYTVLNDISARDLQRSHKQFFKGKSLDGSCPMGPWIITADALPNPQQLQIASRVNNVPKQNSSTKHMIFDIAEIITQLSRGMTLLPGDIIATGTPSGVGFARTPPEFLKPEDIIECEVEGIGLIRNRVVRTS